MTKNLSGIIYHLRSIIQFFYRHTKLLLVENRYSNGFSLIELLVVFATMALLAMTGIGSFVSYSRTQALNQSTLDVVTMLNLAKARARTQVKPTQGFCDPSGTNLSLRGYVVQIETKNKYNLKVLCGIEGQEQQYTIDTQYVSKTSNTDNPIPYFHDESIGKSIMFKVLSGGVSILGSQDSTATIRIDAYGMCKKITVDANGRIIYGATCP